MLGSETTREAAKQTYEHRPPSQAAAPPLKQQSQQQIASAIQLSLPPPPSLPLPENQFNFFPFSVLR